MAKKTFPNIEIHHLTDENPQYPEEHPDFGIYGYQVYENLSSKIDIVFSSEIYGEELAQYLNAKHVCIDLERKTFPISGSQIRKNPMRNWDLISNAAKPYFVQKIVLYALNLQAKQPYQKISKLF